MTPQTSALRELEESFPASELLPEEAFGSGGTTYLSADSFIAGSRGQTWRTLAKDYLEYHHDAMLFLTPRSFVDYLPAYLAAVATGGPEIRNLPAFLRSALTRTFNPQRFDAWIGHLSHAQQRAVAHVLMEIERSKSSRLDKEEMVEVVDSYWRGLIQGEHA